MADEAKRRVSAREGKVILDGETVLDAVKFKIVSTPEVANPKSIGERSYGSRYLSLSHKVTVTAYRTTKKYRKAIQKYMDTVETPTFTIQGISNDKYSDYYDTNGIDTVTATGCVITSDVSWIDLDSGGEFVQDEIEMSAYNVT